MTTACLPTGSNRRGDEDLHYLRQVRHLELLLDRARLTEKPPLNMAEARRSGVAAAYRAAQERVIRTFAALANTRCRELTERTERQVARMTQYYADLRAELAEQRARIASRAEPGAEELSKFSHRLEALEREERLRIAELRQKSALRVQLRLLNLLIVRQPKLLLRATVSHTAPAQTALGGTAAPRHTRAPRPISQPVSPAPLELVWDPLTESLEASCCAQCRQPTYAFDLTRLGTVTCLDCAGIVAAGKHRK